MDKISVIILTRNSQKYIGQCLDSILIQKYPNFEIVIVDANSIDNTLSIVLDYKVKSNISIDIVSKNYRISVGEARRIGMELANGNILAYIDSDVELPHENWLDNMYKPFLSGSVGIAGVQTLAKTKVNDSKLLKKIHSSFEYKYPIIDKEHYQQVGTSHLLIKKDLIELVGGFNNEYSGEDVGVTKAIIDRGYYFVYLKEEKVYHYHFDTFGNYMKKHYRDINNALKDKKYWRAIVLSLSTFKKIWVLST